MPALSGSERALMFAQSGVIRAGASRAGYHGPKVFLTIAGTHYGTGHAVGGGHVDMASLTITDYLDETPNTLQCCLRGVTPTVGQELIVTLGSKNTLVREFGGVILSVTNRYDLRPINQAFDISAIDWTYLLGRRKVLAQYTSESASTIASSLIANFTAGFTTDNVQAGLASVDEITFTNQDVAAALTALAKRVGAFWFIDYQRDLHFFTTDTTFYTNPTDLTSAHDSLRDFAAQTDYSQVVTRVYVEGGGVNAIAACAVGETILPVEDPAWYPDSGVVACGPQRLQYTGRLAGGGGSLVGPGAAPGGRPTLAIVVGAGVDTGSHDYAFTFVTAAGESLPSAIASITVGTAIDDPTAVLVGTYTNLGEGGPYPFDFGDGARSWAYTLVTAAGESLPSPLLTKPAILGTGPFYFKIDTLPTGPATVTARNIYRTVGGGAQLKYVGVVSDNTTTVFHDHIADVALGANVPTTSTATTGNQVAISTISIGGTGTTSRKIYRTTSGGTQLKLQQTIANNTAVVGVTDATADASLGANVPTSDTSALTQPDGQVLPGATSIIVASVAPFASSGWAIIGNGAQVIRYVGKSDTQLTGIPASGDGSITATVAYSSTITQAPALIGIPASDDGAILVAIRKGDPVNLLVQVDDGVAQAILSASLGGDGIVEEYFQDGRLSYTEALARATAHLTLRSAALVSVGYRCRDRNSRTGKAIVVNLPAPTSVAATFKIQQVQASDFGMPNAMPTYTVMASSEKFTFEQLLRLVKGS